MVRLRQRRLARSARRQRRGPDDSGARAGARSVSVASTKAIVPQRWKRALRGRQPVRRRGVPVVGGRARRRLRRYRQRRRHRRRRGQQQRTAAPARSTTSAIASIGSVCGWSAPRGRDMLGARVEVVRKTGAHALAARTRRRQLRVGQRSAGARRPRRLDGDADRYASDGRMAGRTSGTNVAIDRYTTLTEPRGK